MAPFHIPAPFGRGISIPLAAYVDQNQRQLDLNIHGSFVKVVDADTIAVADSPAFTNGLGKLVFVVVAGAKTTGTFQIQGIKVDRDTGAETPGFTEDVVIDGQTTDNSDTDAEGNVRHAFSKAYISSSWYRGAVTLVSAAAPDDVDISDLDVYNIAFEQWNDSPNFTLDTLDFTSKPTNTSAWMYCYLYAVVPGTGNEVVITREATIDLPVADIVTTTEYYRKRIGEIAKAMDGSSDGFWVDLFVGRNNQTDWEDINVKVWSKIKAF